MSFLGNYFALRLAHRHNRLSAERRYAKQFRQTRTEKRIAEHRTTRDIFNGTYRGILPIGEHHLTVRDVINEKFPGLIQGEK
jgi:hypothetical protein